MSALVIDGHAPEERGDTRWRTWLGWIGVALAALALSLVVQLTSVPGRAAAADLLERVIGSRIRGHAEIGAISELDLLGHMTMIDFVVTTPKGGEVMRADRLYARFAPLESLSRGALVLADGRMEGGTMRVTRGDEDQIALLDALEVPSDRRMIPVELEGVELSQMRMVLRLPPLPLTLEIANVRGTADLRIGHEVEMNVRGMEGAANLPVVDVGLHHMHGVLHTDDARPMDIHTRVDLDVADPTMRLYYDAPHAVGRAGGAGLSVALGEGVPDEMGFGTVHRDD